MRKKNQHSPQITTTDYVINELNKAASTDDLILLAMGLEWMENMSQSSY